MFVRVKKVGPYQYLQIAENRREGKRVKQSIIATLGRLDKLTASGAIDQLLRSAARFRNALAPRRRTGDLDTSGITAKFAIRPSVGVALRDLSSRGHRPRQRGGVSLQTCRMTNQCQSYTHSMTRSLSFIFRPDKETTAPERISYSSLCVDAPTS